MPNFQGYWNLPCGYLDWDETLYQAVLREVWEETGLILADLNDATETIHSHNLPVINQVSVMPWLISDRPGGQKQNISHHFEFLFHWQGEVLPALTIDNAEPNEAEAAEWFLLDDALGFDLAFRHADCLAQLLADKKTHFETIAQSR